VPEIVKPPTKRTKRPHTFIRRPEITRVQEFAKPNKVHDPWPNMRMKNKVIPQEKRWPHFVKYSSDLNRVVTDPPMTLLTASGLFEPPSTLLFGFKPLTTTISFKTTPTTRMNKGYNSAKNIKFGFKPTALKPNTNFRSSRPDAHSSKQYSESQRDSFFDKINNLVQPITRIMNG
jgi:hypothetical protein